MSLLLMTQIRNANACMEEIMPDAALPMSIRSDADQGCSNTVGVDDRLGKGAGSFLRQIVSNTAFDDPVRVFTGEFFGVSAGVRVRCSIGIAFERDRRHRDHRTLGKPLLQIV